MRNNNLITKEPVIGSITKTCPKGITAVYGKQETEIYLAQGKRGTTEMNDFKNKMNGQQASFIALDSDSEVVLQQFELIEIENLDSGMNVATLGPKYFAEIDQHMADEYLRILNQLSDLDLKRLADGDIVPFFAKRDVKQMVRLFDYPELDRFPNLSVRFGKHERVLEIAAEGKFDYDKGKWAKKNYSSWEVKAWDVANPIKWSTFGETAYVSLYFNVLKNLTNADVEKIGKGEVLHLEEKEILKRAAPLRIDPASIDTLAIFQKMVKSGGKYRFFMIADRESIGEIVNDALR